ncbi:hypothetical protein ACFQ1S_33905, partial [Kibdelosporangium lantanae]
MRAAVVRTFNGPIEIVDVPVPSPGPGQVLVKVVPEVNRRKRVHRHTRTWLRSVLVLLPCGRQQMFKYRALI